MRDSEIQWCDDTVNPTMGCDGCELWSKSRRSCYAGVLTELRAKKHPGFPPSFDQVTLFPGRMARVARASALLGEARPTKPWLDGSPRLIFVSDMGDSLSRDIPFEYLESEIVRNAESPQGRHHRWLWLTKRPERMAALSRQLQEWGIRWPPNLWAGTSVTAAAKAERIDHLLEVGDVHTVRFLSVEPQLRHVDLTPWLSKLDWVIQGGESGHRHRAFDLAWARDLRESCRDAGVPYFLKQLGARALNNGSRIELRDGHGGDWDEWPQDLRVRQVPTVRLPRVRFRPEVLRKALAPT